MSGRNFLFISIILAAVILYGSLYPFQFHAHEGAGPLLTLIGSWRHRPGRGDFLSNIALYVPLGFFCCLVAGRKRAWPARLGVAVLCGFALSLAMELIQYYDDDRDTEATDLYANTLGTLMGAIPALFNPALGWGTGFRLKIATRIPLLLLAAWLSYKLFPFVPVIDLHKYWHAVRPLLTHQIPTADLFRHFATWTLAAIAVRFVVSNKAVIWYGALFGFVMLAKIFVSGGVLSLAEIAGGALALPVLALVGRFPRPLTIVGTLLLTAYIALFRLMPLQWLAAPRPFGWTPFLSLMQGSVIVDMLSFLEKFYLYGGLIWLLRECGMRLRTASIAVAILLFAASWAERYLPGRSAEITDALLALIIGVGFALLEDAKTGKTA